MLPHLVEGFTDIEYSFNSQPVINSINKSAGHKSLFTMLFPNVMLQDILLNDLDHSKEFLGTIRYWRYRLNYVKK